MIRLIKNISKGVAFVHTLNNGIIPVKPGEAKEFELEEIVFKEDIFKEGSFFIDLTDAEEEEKPKEDEPDKQGEKDSTSKGEPDKQGEKDNTSKEGNKGEDTEENKIISMKKEYLELSGEEYSGDDNQEQLEAALEKLRADVRLNKIEELKKAIARNNKTLIAELLSELNLSESEKASLLPNKPAQNRKKTTTKKNI